MLQYEAKAVRAFKQSIDRLLWSVASERGRCAVCIRQSRACVRKHLGRRWVPTGRCAQCGHWRRLAWWPSRHVYACSACLAKPRLPARPRDCRKPRVTLSWVREMADTDGHLDNPHRHCRALMPFIPQDVLSKLAARAGLGEVLDVRVDREETATARGALEFTWLSKRGCSCLSILV